MPTNYRIALAHDWLCGYRGGEAVLDRLARIVLADHVAAGLYVMTDDGQPLTDAIDALAHTRSALSSLPGGSGRFRRWLLPLYPRAVAQLSGKLGAAHKRQPISLLVSTSSAAIKGLRPPPGVPHLCYCHTPARYIWSQSAQYEAGLRGVGLRLVRERYRAWDRASAQGVTRFIANSQHTAREIERCFGMPSAVVHPPVRTEFFTPDPAIQREDFWLCVGALEPYKRVEIAIAAAALAGKRLVVVGTGSCERALRSAAGPDTVFEGGVNHERLRDLYRRAAVLLFPQVEDFGIVAVEAQACGLPVVAAGAGGALDSVQHGSTGELVTAPTADSLAAAAVRVTGCVLRDARPWAQRCRANAVNFSEERFDCAMRSEMLSLLPAST